MYGYYTEQLKTDYNKAWTAWKEIKTQLDEVYVLDHTSRACKARITRALNDSKDWFKRVESLMNRLPKDKQPSSAVLTELGKEMELRYLSAFSGLSCTVSDLPIGKDRKKAIMIVVNSITDDYVARMKGTLKSLVD